MHVWYMCVVYVCDTCVVYVWYMTQNGVMLHDCLLSSAFLMVNMMRNSEKLMKSLIWDTPWYRMFAYFCDEFP